MLHRSWLVGSIVLLAPSLATAETYVVAPGGDDGASGLAGSPWATLQHAADSVVAGDTVSVEPGEYAGFNVTRSGSMGAPITFSAKPGVIITSPNGQTGQDGINIEDTDNGEVVAYVVVEGFDCSNMPRAGIRTAVSSHVTIRHNKADQNGVWGILTGFADDVLIEDNECSRSGDEHGIYVSNSGDRPIIRRNVLWSNNANGIHMNGDASLGGDGVISNALVEGNIIYDNGLAGGSGINCDGVSDSRIQNNLIFNTHASGISLYQIDGGEPSQNNVIANNTILVASNGRWALNIREGAVNNKVRNNILLNEHSFRGAIDIAMDALPGFVSNNNVMIDRFTLDEGGSVLELQAWQAATGQDMASSITPPTFAAAGSDDYHLQPASEGVDQGTEMEAPGADLDGIARPQGAGFDIGAYELCTSGNCPMGAGGGGTGGNGSGGNGSGGNATGGDGSGGADGGSGGGGSEGGCGCRTTGEDPAGGAALLAAVAAALSASRRRKAPRSRGPRAS
jgi:MYXO-CTERM domain-containing protein